MAGAYCETYGNTIRNRILEVLLETGDLDCAISDIVEDTGISKPKVYQTIKEFEDNGYVKKTRVIGKTQLYALNKENKRVKLFMYDFKQVLKMVLEEHSEPEPVPKTTSHKVTAPAGC